MTSPILLFAFLISASHALNLNCPSPENIAPCICKDLGNGPMMLCNNLMSAEELVVPVRNAENHDMFSLAVHDSSLLYIPNKIFKNTYFKKIRFAETQLMSLAETDVAFESLEDTLEEFRVMDAHYVTQWSWSQLRNLQKLQLIDVDLVSLGTLDQPFPPLKSLTHLGITNADISFIVDNAFSNLENIKILVLKNNDISYLSRSMFPDPAEQLFLLDLSGNKLNILPPNIFHGMPNLNDLFLKDNEFVTLNEAVFSPIMGSLYTLLLGGNQLRCDCRIRWIVGTRTPQEFDAVCSLPENLKGSSVKHLAAKDVWC